MAVAIDSATGRRSQIGQRLDGIDVARALAFAGMVLAHYVGPLGATDPGWLRGLTRVADGRAAPLFCVLLGVGAGILAARGTPDHVFVARGLLLFALGLLIWPGVDWVYLILPHYGVLLAGVPLLRRIPTRWLLPAAGLAFAIPSVVVATVAEHRLRAGRQPDAWGDAFDVAGLFRHLFWTGGYPLVGWTGFVLVGLWVARRRPRWRTPFVRLGQCALSAYLAHLAIGELWVWEWRIEDHPVMPAQLVVAGAVIAGLTMLATHWRARFARGPIEAALRWASG